MRVLHVLPTRASEYGGPVRVAEAFSAQLLSAGHVAEIFPDGGTTNLVPRTFAYWPGIRGLRSLRASIRAADLVHVHGLWSVPTSAAALYARSANRPFVVTPHGMLDRWSLGHHSLRKRVYAAIVERRNLDAATALHFFNEEEREEAQAFGIRAPTFLLPNGVDLAQFSELPGRAALWQRYPVTANRQTILFLGRVHPKKGLPLLIPAFARVLTRTPDLQLVIAGPDEGGHRAQVEALVARHRLEGHVLFTGAVDGEEKRILLGAADLFVLPSHQEGDSVAVKEALAAELPVVITRACHFPQVAELQAGFVINPAVDEIERALDRLCRDHALRKRMAGQAHALAERYRWDLLGQRLVAWYEALLARHESDLGIEAGVCR